VRLEQANHSAPKGWYAGPWNSDLAISVGYANKGVDEPHVHTKINEIYLVARGTAVPSLTQFLVGRTTVLYSSLTADW
jgi:hypothetical protein